MSSWSGGTEFWSEGAGSLSSRHLLSAAGTRQLYLHPPFPTNIKEKNKLKAIDYSAHKSCNYRPGWCGSVDWDCEPGGHQFNSQSGHMPGLWARSLVGGMWEATTHWCFSPTISPSLLLSKNTIKSLKKKGYNYHWVINITEPGSSVV